MLVSDKWNPRLWLRDWLNDPSAAEKAKRRATEVAPARLILAEERMARANCTSDVASALRLSCLQDVPREHRKPATTDRPNAAVAVLPPSSEGLP